MKKRSLFTIIQWGGVLFLLALLTSCPGSSDIKIHTVTFDLGYDGAPPPEKVEIEDGDVLPSVKDPAQDGYQFDGWYTADGTLYDFKTPVTESFTLTARWTIESSGGSGGGSVPTDKELLEGQWAVYYQSPSDSSGDFQPYEYLLIDIQHTLSEYWIIVYTDEDPVIEAPVKSDRTETEDGWFVVSLPALPEGEIGEMKIRYKFADEERNTMEAEVIFPENEGSLKCIMRRLNHVIEILPLSEAENPEEGEETSPIT